MHVLVVQIQNILVYDQSNKLLYFFIDMLLKWYYFMYGIIMNCELLCFPKKSKQIYVDVYIFLICFDNIVFFNMSTLKSPMNIVEQ
jgi:hypothetical protein